MWRSTRTPTYRSVSNNHRLKTSRVQVPIYRSLLLPYIFQEKKLFFSLSNVSLRYLSPDFLGRGDRTAGYAPVFLYRYVPKIRTPALSCQWINFIFVRLFLFVFFNDHYQRKIKSRLHLPPVHLLYEKFQIHGCNTYR